MEVHLVGLFALETSSYLKIDYLFAELKFIKQTNI